MTSALPDFGVLETARFRLRALHVDDVTENYLGWFTTSGAKHITASPDQTLDTLRSYVAMKWAKPDTLFLGIFDAVEGNHIGNIKYEPIDLSTGEAVMGIFIGDPHWQGRGAGPEVIRASATWLNTECGVKSILLGVAVDNQHAVQAYTKVGFRPIKSAAIPAVPGGEVMALDITHTA